jgi:CHAT domain-containing protein/Flp pilus assembly protein TadD
MLAHECREGFAAIAPELPATPSNAVSEQQDGNWRLSGSETAPQNGKLAQNRQPPVKDQSSEPQVTNPFETLKLALEGNQLGASLTREGVTEAIKKYKAAFAVYQSQGNKLGMAATLFACGTAYYFLGQMREAVNTLLEASQYSKESGFDFLRPLLDATIGAAYAALGETSKALEWLDRALPTIQRMNEPRLLAMTLTGLGIVNARLGQKRKAMEYLNQALELYRQSKDRWLEFQVVLAFTVVTCAVGESKQALVAANRALDLSREIGSREGEGFSHFALGAVHDSIGDQQRAFEEYSQALHLFQEENSRIGQALAYGNLAAIYLARGEIDKALDCLTHSREYSKDSSEPELLGSILGGLGALSEARADPVSALRYYQKALSLVRDKRDLRLEASVLLSIAEIYHVFSDYERATDLLKKAAAAFRELEDPTRQSVALDNLAVNYVGLGHYEEALDSLRQALEIQRGIEDRKGQATTLRNMGVVYQAMGRPTEALKWYKEALLLMQSIQNTLDQTIVYQAMGAVTYQSTRDFVEASNLYLRALNLARTAGPRINEAFVLADLGYLNELQGNPTQAEGFYDQAMAASESLRTSARIEEFKTELANKSTDLYSRAVLLKFRLNKWSEAFELSERARARTFLDQINNVHLDVKKGADPKLVDQEQSLRAEIRSLDLKLRKEMMNNPSSEAEGLLRERLKTKQKDYANLLLHLKVGNPDYAELRSYFPRSLNEIQRLLGPQTTLVSYFVTAEKTLAFVVGSNSFQAVEIPVKEADLRAAIDWFRGFASLRDPQPQSLKQLDDWLIAPIRQYLKTAEVVIVPHGILHYVPFAALTDGRNYFGDDHAIYYLPSASILPSLRRRSRRAGQRLLSMAQSQAPGLPSLRYADEEARNVAKLYHTRSLPTGRATRAEFLKRAGAYNVLHIAAHAELNATSPLFSRILLSADRDDSGAIEVREIYGMDLTRTNLVALSACETQLGARSKGDDIVGLNRAFIYAGASSVIASLWTVDDEATSLLMKAFYGHLKQGMSKAAALQAAQTATRKKYPHPYYWAAFVLTGDPGRNSRR